MDSDSEFLFLSHREREIIRSYFDVEGEFIAAKNFYKSDRNILLRKLAVSLIAQCYTHISKIDTNLDTFIPYLAMNYFDRYLSSEEMNLKDVEGQFFGFYKDVEGRSDTRRIRLIAVSCFTISAKMRTDDFSVDQLLEYMNVRIEHQMIMRMELLILKGLKWEMQSLNAFGFLNYYYPYFKQYGGFKRRCINEIIVQAQGDHIFVQYLPSQIALSAFLTAAKMIYPTKFDEIEKLITFQNNGSKKQVKECVKQMIDLCIRLNIEIESGESGIGSNSSKGQGRTQNKGKTVVDSSEEKEDGQDMGKMQTTQMQEPVEVEKSPDPDDKIMVAKTSDEKDVTTEEIEPEKQRLLAKGKGQAGDVAETYDSDKASFEAKIQGGVTETDDADKAGDPTKTDDADKAGVVTETDDSDKARVEAKIQKTVENGKAVVGEEPQMEVSISEIEEVPKKLMNFELKWPTEVQSLGSSQELLQPGNPDRVNCGCNIS